MFGRGKYLEVKENEENILRKKKYFWRRRKTEKEKEENRCNLHFTFSISFAQNFAAVKTFICYRGLNEFWSHIFKTLISVNSLAKT